MPRNAPVVPVTVSRLQRELRRFQIAARCGSLVLLAGCIQLRAPKEPIVINLNVKVEQEIRVKVDSDLEQLFQDKDLFGTTEKKS